MIQFAIYTSPTGALIADYSYKIQGASVATNNRGFAEASGFIPMGIQEAFLLYDRPGLPHVRFSDDSSGAIYEGRLEDVNIVNGGVNVRAMGYSRAMTDVPYTALWSTTDYSKWRPIAPNESAAAALRTPDKYNISISNAGGIRISLKKGQTYATGADIASVILMAPHRGNRQIVGFSLDMQINLPNPGGASWQFFYDTWNEGYAAGAFTAINPGGGVVYNRTAHYVTTACDYLELGILNNSGVANAPAGDDGTWFVQITNLRVVTSTANRVNTLMSAIGAGGVQTITPHGGTVMANIYVGQQLQIANNLINSESVTVTAVTATTFTATFAGPHVNTDPINAHVIYADEIVKDMLSATTAVNTAQLSTSTALIQAPQRDLFNEWYEDQASTDILDRLVALGDNQTPPRQWEWGVLNDRCLYYRPQNSAGRTWYVDISDLNVQRTIDSLANNVYADYQDAFNRTLRSATNADTTSVTRYGLIRQRMVSVPTVNSSQATTQRDAYLADNKDPKPRSGLTVQQVYDATGQRWPLQWVRAGDTMIVRNLPPTLSVSIDKIRVFRLTRAQYQPDTDALAIEPELPLPSLSALLALATTPRKTLASGLPTR